MIAQDGKCVTVNPLHPTNMDYPLVNLYVWGAGCSEDIGYLFLDSSYRGNKGRLHCASFSTGIGTEIKVVSLDIGYRLGLYTYDLSWAENSGIYTHSLSLDIGSANSVAKMGITANYLLGTHANNDHQSGYEGFNKDCFRRFNWGFYYGAKLGVNDFTIEGKLIWWFNKPLIANKVSFYNMEHTRIDQMLGLELKLYYRIFSNGQKRINSAHIND